MDITATVNQVKRFSALFNSVIDMAGILEEMGNVEAAYKAGTNKVAKINQEISAAETKLSSVADKLLAADQQAAAIVEDGKKRAESLVASAQSIVETAKADSNKIRQEAQSTVKNADDYVAEKKQFLSGLLAEIDNKNRELAEMNEKIEATKSKLRAFVGG